MNQVKMILARHVPQFRTNLLRTALTLLGMVFGVGSVVAMVSIGQGAQAQILATIDALGATNTHIKAERVSAGELGDAINSSAGLTRGDVRALTELVPEVTAAAYRLEHTLRSTDLLVPLNQVHVFGVSPNLLELHGLEVAAGRPLLDMDHSTMKRTVVIGRELADELFDDGALGKIIRLDYAYFEVVGILKERSKVDGDMAIDPNEYNRSILVPYSTMTDELRPSRVYGELDLISLKTSSIEETLTVKRAVQPILASLHGDVEDYAVVAPEEILQQKQATQSALNMVLICIAAISLVVGGIGVMNIMLANIMERTGEIGLRRAVGAKKHHIRNQFLTEAILICFVGGLVGIVLGYVISVIVAWAVDIPIAFAWESMVASFGISVAVGLIFGLMPAMRAANFNPIEALHA